MDQPVKTGRGVSGAGSPASYDSRRPGGSHDTVLLSDAPENNLTETIVAPVTPFQVANLSSTALAALNKRYDILGEAGHGSMGNVYKARDRETGETIALKLLKPEIASDQAMMERFKNELLFARKITHKNVCRVHEFNRVGGVAYTSMEFVEGENLRSVLNRFGGLPQRKAVNLALQICSGLKEAHAQGIVHRDLKPENIMVDANGNVKIMDFGIARSMEAVTRMTGSMVGTPQYMAPEQVGGKPVDYRTDIYSLGLILYEMFTGAPAFQADNPVAVALKQMQEEAVPPHEIDPAIPAYIERTILKCLLKNPANRFQSIAQLENALNGSEPQNPAGGAVPARAANAQKNVSSPATARIATPSLPPAATRRKGVSPIVWILLGAVMVLGALGVMNGITKKKAAAEMIPPPAAFPAPVPPDFAYVSSPPKSPVAVSNVNSADAEPSKASPAADPSSKRTVAPYTNLKPDIAKNNPTLEPKSETDVPEASPPIRMGRAKRPSADEAAATLRADAAARNSGKTSPPKKSAQPSTAASTPATPALTSGTTGASYLLIGHYIREDRAKDAAKTIDGLGMPTGVIPKHGLAGDYYVVYSGPFPNEQIAGAMKKLRQEGFYVRSVPVTFGNKNARQ
ncbi:MAG: serine/threonine-protein kinase [Candidatus Acidiferrales bacterium]